MRGLLTTGITFLVQQISMPQIPGAEKVYQCYHYVTSRQALTYGRLSWQGTRLDEPFCQSATATSLKREYCNTLNGCHRRKPIKLSLTEG